jgi:hypothetical protein
LGIVFRGVARFSLQMTLREHGTVLVCPPSRMALPFDQTPGVRDPKALAILAKTIYRELRGSGYAERDVMTLAGELLGMVATEVKGRREQS